MGIEYPRKIGKACRTEIKIYRGIKVNPRMWTCSRTPVQDGGGERAASFLDNVAACNGGTSYSSLLRSSDGEALIIRDSTTVLEKRCCVIYAIKTTRYLLQSLSLSSLLSFSLFLLVRKISFLSRSINPIRNVLQFIRTVERKKTTRRASFHFFPGNPDPEDPIRNGEKCREQK